MIEISATFGPQTFQAIGNVISLLASADGHLRCNSLSGRLIDLFGRALARASHSAPRESARAFPTVGTCGPSLPGSLASAALQSSLANKLQAQMAGFGSPEYSLIWKQWAMPSRVPICAQRARARRISDSDFTGWHTPKATDGSHGGPNQSGGSLPRDAAVMSGWATPTVRDQRSGKHSLETWRKGARPLNEQAWRVVGWPTATVNDSRNGRNATAVRMPDSKHHTGTTLSDLAFGQTTNGSEVLTANTGALNPAFVCWLMGYPAGWENFAASATRLSRKSRLNSSVQVAY